MKKLLYSAALLMLVVSSAAYAQSQKQSRTVYDMLSLLYGIPVAPNCSVTFNNVGATAARLGSNDPKRVSVFIMNLSSGVCAYGFNGQTSLSQGVSLGSSGGNATEDFRTDLVLPTYEHWAICTNAGETVLFEQCLLN